MANSQTCSYVLDITAGEAIPANRFVGFNNSLASAGSKSKGVSVASISNGATGAIALLGIVTIETGDDFYAGDEICCGSNGLAAAQSGGDAVNGYALEDGTSGDFIEIILK